MGWHVHFRMFYTVRKREHGADQRGNEEWRLGAEGRESRDFLQATFHCLFREASPHSQRRPWWPREADIGFKLCSVWPVLLFDWKTLWGWEVPPWASICLPSKLLPLYCTLWSQNGREGRRRGIQWGSSGLPVQEQSSVLPTGGVGDNQINKDGRDCGSQRRHP